MKKNVILITQKKNELCKYYKDVEIEGTAYKIGAFVVLNTKKSEIEFGHILDIIFLENEIYFYLNIFEELTFDFHYHAYIVNSTGEKRQ